MTIAFLILSSLVLALCEGGEILTTCDLVGLNLCAWKLGQNISKEYDGELSAMPSPEQVALLCRFRPEYKMCYQSKVPKCGINLVYLSTLGTTQSTADFLCGEGNSDLLQHSSCWEKPLVRNTTNQCNKNYATSAQKLLNLNNNHMMTKAETTEWCSIINISSVCMYDTVLDNCDLDAASFVVTMMKKAMAKLTSFLKCYGEESSLPVPDVSTADNTSTITRRSLAKLPSSAGNAQGVPYNGAGGARLSGGLLLTTFIAYIYLLEFCALKLS